MRRIILAISLFVILGFLLYKGRGGSNDTEVEVREIVMDDEEEKVVDISSTLTPTPFAETEILDTSENLSDIDSIRTSLVYPNANIIMQNKLLTTDDIEVVTNWYKEEINNLDFEVTSFVTTSVNGKIENTLSASAGEGSLKINISRSSNSQEITIIILDGR